jgi:hypothetical protein
MDIYLSSTRVQSLHSPASTTSNPEKDPFLFWDPYPESYKPPSYQRKPLRMTIPDRPMTCRDSLLDYRTKINLRASFNQQFSAPDGVSDCGSPKSADHLVFGPPWWETSSPCRDSAHEPRGSRRPVTADGLAPFVGSNNWAGARKRTPFRLNMPCVIPRERLLLIRHGAPPIVKSTVIFPY